MDVFCSGSAGYSRRVLSSSDGETCTTVLLSLSTPTLPVLLPHKNSSVIVGVDVDGGGGGGGGGGSAGLSNITRLSGLLLCLT